MHICVINLLSTLLKTFNRVCFLEFLHQHMKSEHWYLVIVSPTHLFVFFVYLVLEGSGAIINHCLFLISRKHGVSHSMSTDYLKFLSVTSCAAFCTSLDARVTLLFYLKILCYTEILICNTRLEVQA